MDKTLFIILYGKSILLMVAAMTMVLYYYGQAGVGGKNTALVQTQYSLVDTFQERIAYWNKEIDSNPFSLDARLRYAEATFALGVLYERPVYFEQARDILQEALEIHPDDVAVVCLLSRTELQLGETEKAAKRIHEFYKSSLHNSALIVRAEIAFEAGAYKQAFEDVTRSEGVQSDVYSKLVAARVFRAFGRFGDSIDQLEQAREQTEELSAFETALVAYSIGEHYLAKQELDNADLHFRGALTAAPGFFAASAKLAEVLDTLGKYSEAEQVLEQLLVGRRVPVLLDRLAMLKERAGKVEVAQSLRAEALERAKSAYKNKSDSGMLYGQFLLNQDGREFDALRVLRKVHDVYPERLDANFLLAKAYYQSNQLQKAREHSRRALRLGQAPAAYYELAQLIERDIRMPARRR